MKARLIESGVGPIPRGRQPCADDAGLGAVLGQCWPQRPHSKKRGLGAVEDRDSGAEGWFMTGMGAPNFVQH